jgi:DNA repair protein RecN (Recombination protein N)
MSTAGLQAIVDLIEPARIQLQEAVYALNDYLDRVDLDPQRLQSVEARMEAIHSAARKFRVEDQLPQEHEQLSARLSQMADASDIDGLRQQEQKLKARTWRRRSNCRPRAARPRQLGDAVTQAMQDLNMTGGRFEIALHAGESARMGWSRWSFWWPATPAWHRVRWPRWRRAANWRASRWRFPSSLPTPPPCRPDLR